jgi:RimJ/RimL family protein N-acetyltransferase
MTEAVVVVNDYWFDVLGFPVLRAPKAVANVASRRISEKTGMRLVATLERDYVSGRLPAEIWEITVEEWRAKRTEFNFERSTIHGRATISVRSGGCLF